MSSFKDLSGMKFGKLLVVERCGSYKSVHNGKFSKKETLYVNGVDRIDSNGAYETSNCVPCCFDCNSAKRVLSQEGFFSKIEKIYNIHLKGKEMNALTLVRLFALVGLGLGVANLVLFIHNGSYLSLGIGVYVTYTAFMRLETISRLQESSNEDQNSEN